MDTKSLLIGISSFMAGGLLVSIAAVTFDKNEPAQNQTSLNTMNHMNVGSSAESLKTKSGDDFDKSFIQEMIAHHESAVEMAKLSSTQAKHEEIKTLSSEIILAQEKEKVDVELGIRGQGGCNRPLGNQRHRRCKADNLGQHQT